MTVVGKIWAAAQGGGGPHGGGGVQKVRMRRGQSVNEVQGSIASSVIRKICEMKNVYIIPTITN